MVWHLKPLPSPPPPTAHTQGKWAHTYALHEHVNEKAVCLVTVQEVSVTCNNTIPGVSTELIRKVCTHTCICAHLVQTHFIRLRDIKTETHIWGWWTWFGWQHLDISSSKLFYPNMDDRGSVFETVVVLSKDLISIRQSVRQCKRIQLNLKKFSRRYISSALM